MKSIGKGVLGGSLSGITIDLGHKSEHFNCPTGVSVSPEGLIYICDYENHHVTINNEEGKFHFAVGLKGSGSGCFNGSRCITFGSDGLEHVTDVGKRRVCVWSKEGTFGGRGSGPGWFDMPCGICVDDSGLVYVVDYVYSRVQVF